MSGCQTCGGGMGKHDEAAHGDWPDRDQCNGMCVMGNEVVPGGGFFDVAAYPHPECPRHGGDAMVKPHWRLVSATADYYHFVNTRSVCIGREMHTIPRGNFWGRTEG